VGLALILPVTSGQWALAGDTAGGPADGPARAFPVLFTAPLPDVPGMRLRVVRLAIPPATGKSSPHRHPGSVYVYIVQGAARLGLEGQPVQTVHAGESFFEPKGALHTVAESVSPTESATAIAVMIEPDDAQPAAGTRAEAHAGHVP
jgi:quercetin dioxygenase-like cupin family protein